MKIVVFCLWFPFRLFILLAEGVPSPTKKKKYQGISIGILVLFWFFEAPQKLKSITQKSNSPIENWIRKFKEKTTNSPTENWIQQSKQIEFPLQNWIQQSKQRKTKNKNLTLKGGEGGPDLREETLTKE